MSSSIPVLLERDNVNDETVILTRWFARHGDRIEANSLLAEVETSKANLEVYAPAGGFLVWAFPEGADVPVAAPIGHITSQAPSQTPKFNEMPTAPSPEVPWKKQEFGAAEPVVTPVKNGANYTADPEFAAVTEFRQRISPVAATMMKTHGLTASAFTGKSVIRKRDILEFLNPPHVSRETASADVAAEPRAPQALITQPYEEIPLSRMKRREGAALAVGELNAVSSAVSVTCFTRGLRRAIESRGTGETASAVIVYEVSRLLRKYPSLNATYRNGAMLRYTRVNLGYAIDDGRGLKVAVLENSDTLSLQQVAVAIRELTVAYLGDRLTPAQIANATFTVSDLSGMGVSSFLPLISENQGGILGVGGEQFAPESSSGFYTLTLAFDHQLSDGRTAAMFLGDLRSRLLAYEGTRRELDHGLACSRCGRTAEHLAASNQHLLRSALPDGYLCTLCMLGY